MPKQHGNGAMTGLIESKMKRSVLRSTRQFACWLFCGSASCCAFAAAYGALFGLLEFFCRGEYSAIGRTAVYFSFCGALAGGVVGTAAYCFVAEDGDGYVVNKDSLPQAQDDQAIGMHHQDIRGDGISRVGV